MRKNLKGLGGFAGITLLTLLATPAQATLTVIVNGTNNGTTVTGGITCVDNTACDTNPAVGVISWNNVAGATINISTQGAKSNSPTAAISMTMNGTPTGTGITTIAVSDNGFTTPPPPLDLMQDVSGTAAASGGSTMTMTATGFFSTSNVDFATNGPTTGPTTPPAVQNGPASNASTTVLPPNGTPYSLTEFVSVNITSIGTGTNKDVQVNADLNATAVPEPASMALLGGALLLTVGAIRRKVTRA